MHFPYYFFIILFSCMDPTLAPDKDCSGVIGGEAVADDCGYCSGGTTTIAFNAYLGCDSTCQGIQYDCESTCGGSAKNDCNGECGGAAFIDYFCEVIDSTGLRNLDSRDLTCLEADETGNCKPNTDSCLFIDCSTNTMYVNTVINCQGELPLCDEASGTCINIGEYLGDGTCDFTDTNCEEFNFDEGDCNLIDCSGLHFSEELCVSIFGQGCTETEGDSSALGDGFCDDGNDDVLPVNFNCEKWGFDGAECICENENNIEYDCWVKTSAGNYDCPSEGEVRGGDCFD
jgi:hypothetical protein